MCGVPIESGAPDDEKHYLELGDTNQLKRYADSAVAYLPEQGT
jgi:hypothetical protein